MSHTEVIQNQTSQSQYGIVSIRSALTGRDQAQDKIHGKVIATVRSLVADLCQQFNGGHPGSAIGMAALGVALYKYVMRYSPLNPSYFNRDRLVLSNGHVCLWQYIFMHFTGFPGMTMDQLKSYHSASPSSICRGHPEIQVDGIEVTTGPLGQGVANAVGLAVASQNLASTYNRPGFHLIDNMTWCVAGDACLQEGVATEAIELAGHWKLSNLAILYDNNGVTCGGTLDVTSSVDINAKMAACGWRVIDVFDGVSNVMALVQALLDARCSKQQRQQPVFVNIRSVIGVGSQFEGQSKAHGTPLGEDGVANIKRQSEMDPKEYYKVDTEVYGFFADVASKGQQEENRFDQVLAAYEISHPTLAKELKCRMEGKMTEDWRKLIPGKEDLTVDAFPSRKTAGIVVAALAKNITNFMLATVDLQPATNMSWEGCMAFQHPDHDATSGMSGGYDGRYLHCGIREHAMASIANGLAAFNRNVVLPVTSGFFNFYLYAAAGVRMGALQGLRTIHLATHDSIAIGDDGPTHQPVELPVLFRAMPNILYVRPCDGEETCGTFMVAMEAETTPTMISLSRHALTQYPQHSDREGVKRGAYVFIEQQDAHVTLIGVGSEMVFAVDAREKLAELGVRARVVSFPCQRLFECQSYAYKAEVLQYSKSKPVVVIEAYVVNGWERYATAGYSMRDFGKSLPANEEVYGFFGFHAEKIARAVKGLVEEIDCAKSESPVARFRDLNGGAMGYGFDPQ